MYDRKLTAAEVRARIDRCYRPYHAAVASALDALHADFGAVWHINCHSMATVGDRNSPDPGLERPDFVLGGRDGCGAAFTGVVASALTAMGYSVAINDPYKGVELVRRYGRPAEHRHSLQIELNRRLYINEETFEKTGDVGKLQADLTRLIGIVAAFARSELAATTRSA